MEFPLQYAGRVLLVSAIMMLYYWIFLRNRRFNRYNRYYLVLLPVLSVLIPLLELNLFRPTVAEPLVFEVLDAVNGVEVDEALPLTGATPATNWMQLLICCAYGIPVAVLLVRQIGSYWQLYRLIRKGNRQQYPHATLICSEAKGTPFSFLQYIFWNPQIDLQSADGQRILLHELAHCRQKHSFDKLLYQTLNVWMWFNPVFWLASRELAMIHEFLADEAAVPDADTEALATMLLTSHFPQHRFSPVNPFFLSPIKRRIQMLQKTPQPRKQYLRRILALPLLGLILLAFSVKPVSVGANQPPVEPWIVVLDAGHGGKDAGAQAQNILEKDLTLALCNKMIALNKNPNLKLILTRTDDRYMSPPEKAAFSNSQHPAMLISIHVDAGSSAAEAGLNLYISRNQFANSNDSRVLASALFSAFKEKYPLPVAAHPVQRERGIWILQASEAPAVLVSPGNMNHPKELDFLRSAAGQELIAQQLLKGIESYFTGKPRETVHTTNTVLPAGTDPAELIQKTGSGSDTINPEKALYVINGEIMDRRNALNRLKLLSGKAPIVAWIQSADAVKKYGPRGKYGVCLIREPIQLKADTLTISGNGNPSNGTHPLYIIDGVQQESAASLNELNPDAIAQVKVWKGDSAIARYGIAGKNGAVEISTKKKQ